MSFSNYKELSDHFIKLGVTKALFKMLSENDNSKQQIYLGGSFDVLQQLPFGEITEYPENKVPNFKAPMNFYWIKDESNFSQAPDTKLILYPKYPEVRLSGFLSKCPTAPSSDMQPIPKESRGESNAKDGRVLIFGISPDRKVYGYLATKNSSLAKDIENRLYNSIPEEKRKILCEFPLESNSDADKKALIIMLRDLVKKDWTPSVRMFSDGSVRPYKAPNSGGYTMEAHFGIIPNGDAEPDYKGWELKAYGSERLTLMTPEPDKGFYHDAGAKEFTIKYGHLTQKPNVKYFTGPFYVNKQSKKSELRMILPGFNEQSGLIDDITGGIWLVDKDNQPVAIWSFSTLLTHWCNKHQHACYMHYESNHSISNPCFKYSPIVHLGEGTDFPMFLKAMANDLIMYDPAIKVTFNECENGKVKPRNQFRINVKKLSHLYNNFEEVDIFKIDI